MLTLLYHFQPLIILFLFCSPELDVLFGLDAPQPFVTIYELALGRGGQVVMTLVAIIGLFIVRPEYPSVLEYLLTFDCLEHEIGRASCRERVS